MSRALGYYASLVLILSCAGCEPNATPKIEPLAPKPSTAPLQVASVPVSSATPDAAAQPAVKTLFVREVLADCEGAEGPRKCMQVRGAEKEEWMLFYGVIEGFKSEPSFAYELRVTVQGVSKPPADGSSLHYRLAEIVSKTRVTPSGK